MNIFFIVALLCVILNGWNAISACSFLFIPLINRHRCSNFSTILACNTALATLIYSITNVWSAIYMIIWDQQAIPIIDVLCPIRAYVYHSSIAAVHHSFMLHVIYKFCKIKGLTILNKNARKVIFIAVQWAFDFIFDLPALLTGNMIKLSSDNFCFVNLAKIPFFIYMALLAYLLPEITINVIHKLLIRHVRQASSRAHANHERNMHRDLVVVRRIVLLSLPMVLIGLPALVVIILTIVRGDLLPKNLLRVSLFITNLPLSFILLILFWYTPELRASVTLLRNRIRPAPVWAVTLSQHRSLQ